MNQAGDAFRPTRWLANPHVQSFIASARLRRALIDANALQAAARRWLLDCGDGVRLLALHSVPEAPAPARPVAVLLHGWEGSADSAYVLSAAAALYRHGVEVVRLNLRDHGDTYDLNEELFHSCRIDEVVGAVAAIAAACPGRPLYLAGWSLGGNFAVRVLQRAPDAGFEPAHTFAVSPPVDPANSYLAMRNGLFIYQRYFLYKWKRSLKRKQAAFPHRYDFSPVMHMRDLREITAVLIAEFTGFATVDDYFAGYALDRDMLEGAPGPLTVLTARDDPVIPVADFAPYRDNARFRLEIHARGGHCGFMPRLGAHSWVDARLCSLATAG